MLNKLSSFQSYLIGLMQGDGHMYTTTRNRGSLRYEISIRDKDIVYKLEKLLVKFHTHVSYRTRDTNFKKDYHSISFVIHNLAFRKWLNTYVPYGRKSDVVKPPKNVITKDYIRGLTDADGSIGLTKGGRCFWSLCTQSETVKRYVINHINSLLNLDKRNNKNKRDNIYNIVLYDENAQDYTNFLYHNSELYLDRKYQKYLIVQKWKRSVPKINFKRKRWLKSEDNIILSSKYSIIDLCQMFGRTQKSVYMRLWRLNKISNKKESFH